MRQICIEEIEGIIKLLKNSSIRVNRNELDINMKFDDRSDDKLCRSLNLRKIAYWVHLKSGNHA